MADHRDLHSKLIENARLQAKQGLVKTNPKVITPEERQKQIEQRIKNLRSKHQKLLSD